MREYVGWLAADVRGIVVLANLTDAVERTHLDPSHCVRFLDRARESFQNEILAGVPRSSNLAYLNAISAVAGIGAYGGRISLPSEAPDPVETWNIAKFEDVANYHFSSAYFLARLGATFNSVPTHEKLSRARDYIDKVKFGWAGMPVPAKLGATLGVPGRSLWLSPDFEELVAHLSQEYERATRARDALGLVHFEHGSILVQYQVAASRASLFAPTPLEGNGKRFRVWMDDAVRIRPWGATIDLERFRRGTLQLDGAREATTYPIPLKGPMERQARESLELLGDVMLDEDSIWTENDDARYALVVMRGRSPRSIVDKVEDWIARGAHP